MSFEMHECMEGENCYGSVIRNMGGSEAPHPWILDLDPEWTYISYCPFCGKKLLGDDEKDRCATHTGS